MIDPYLNPYRLAAPTHRRLNLPYTDRLDLPYTVSPPTAVGQSVHCWATPPYVKPWRPEQTKPEQTPTDGSTCRTPMDHRQGTLRTPKESSFTGPLHSVHRCPWCTSVHSCRTSPYSPTYSRLTVPNRTERSIRGTSVGRQRTSIT